MCAECFLSALIRFSLITDSKRIIFDSIHPCSDSFEALYEDIHISVCELFLWWKAVLFMTCCEGFNRVKILLINI